MKPALVDCLSNVQEMSSHSEICVSVIKPDAMNTYGGKGALTHGTLNGEKSIMSFTLPPEKYQLGISGREAVYAQEPVWAM
jgi:hypothetical protein